MPAPDWQVDSTWVAAVMGGHFLPLRERVRVADEFNAHIRESARAVLAEVCQLLDAGEPWHGNTALRVARAHGFTEADITGMGATDG